ncbi:cytochrome-c oxidase, cbb3-type subunit III [Rhizorhabdus dicambivorans]|uniref:Cbb3-type cytochrome c oxidase subunit n=1 Tax=Rhizorhabdus dicambivorans TaxID=1850238 RepID=A0A2A4FQK1_9SPHN|nr:cytochrome-c oxidase, cbb3-type subunit III [Rhizorhabdus dicambivorans]ATE63849.1 cytochrome-c oxidase, cbb3-type subunit III [Rhizorhabdus dicambivorans]PCE40683.1 cytochrome-c oxidase, cbb3-type subunit III [Rhizorhabdus dicambivorans]
MTDRKIDEATGVPTMGHEWDGIEELDNPMPRWWLWTFYATIVFAVGYCIAYPAIPLLERATAGTLGWSSHRQLAEEMAKGQAAHASTLAALAKVDIATLDPKSPLMQAAVEGGRAAFKINCAACHGAGAAGTRGYPNLNDDDWLWGGSRAEIHETLMHGIRQPGNDATRMSQMPAFGRDGILKPEEIQAVVSFVRAASHQETVGGSARRGAALYAANCAMCHGTDAKGGRAFGAPNLTDAIWLYGGDREALTATVTNARYGVMPAWNKTLDAATLNMLTAYVHSLGGGE